MTMTDPRCLTMLRLPGRLAMLLTLCLVAGCASSTTVTDAPAPPPYPDGAEYGPDLDILVIREGEQVRLVNRTARSYDGLELWLNRQYVRPIDRIAIGVDNIVPLPSFINRYREAYPVGSFLRPDRSARLVLAELYDREADVRYRLLVEPPGTR